VAGLLLAGAAPADFSSGTVADPLRLPEPEVVVASDGALVGEVVHVDAFGNLCTNVTAAALRASLPAAARGAPLAGRFICDVGGCQVPLVSTYGQAEVGALLACVGSTGNVEIAVRNGSAERDLAVTRGAPVTVVVRDPAEERR